jgi:hypothetical protein
MSHIVLALGLIAGMDAANSSKVEWQWSEVPICVLRQQISPTGVAIEIGRTPGDGSTSVEVIVPSQSKIRGSHDANGAIRLEPGGDTVADVFQQADPNVQQLHTSASTQDPAFVAKLASASTLQVLGRNIQSVPVTLKAAAAAVGALDTCESQKAREWGIDLTTP